MMLRLHCPVVLQARELQLAPPLHAQTAAQLKPINKVNQSLNDFVKQHEPVLSAHLQSACNFLFLVNAGNL